MYTVQLSPINPTGSQARLNRRIPPLGVVGCTFKSQLQSLPQSLISLSITFDCNILCNRKVPSSILGAEISFCTCGLIEGGRVLCWAGTFFLVLVDVCVAFCRLRSLDIFGLASVYESGVNSWKERQKRGWTDMQRIEWIGGMWPPRIPEAISSVASCWLCLDI